MDCYICGAPHASWPINSRPSENGKPFFPFLEYHTPPENVKKVSMNGKLLACNVCYSFLIQQWNSYESNETPLVKRLYWLKHASGLQEPCDIDQNSFYDKDNSLSESESSSNSYQPFSKSQFDTSKVTSLVNTDELQNRCLSRVVTESPHSKAASHDGLSDDTESKSTGIKAVSFTERRTCFVCRKSKPAYQLRTLHSRPQLKLETPFYPCLATQRADSSQLIDAQGRVLSCEECHQVLFCQWQLFSKNGTPFSERRYNFHTKFPSQGDGESTFVCFLCGISKPLPANYLSSKSDVANRPYFLFLKNLREPTGAESIDRNGNIKACTNCSRLLCEQWYLYQKAGVSEPDWVFSIINRKEPDSESKVVSPASVPGNIEILCFVCHKTDARKNMREVYSNPYANMDLSFLEQIEKIPGTYFSRKLGQSLVCNICYDSLKNQWKKFDTEDVQLRKRDYKLHRYGDQETDPSIKCEICTIEIPIMESKNTYIFARKNEAKPYFPFLSKMKDHQRTGRLKVHSCKFCHSNLISQWNFYETLSQTDEDRFQRHYKPHHFVCYICGDTTHRSDSRIIDQRLCEMFTSSGHIKPPCAIEINNMVIICLRCKVMLDDGKKEKRSVLQEPLISTIKKEMVEEDTVVRLSEEHTSNQQSDSETETSRGSPHSEDPTECAGMKVTATVPPLPIIAKRNLDRPIMQNQASTSRNDDEGSFAAALRKLAQQAIVPVARKPTNRERQTSPSGPAVKPGSNSQESHKSPSSLSHPRQQSQSPFYLRASAHGGNIPSSLAPVIPPSSVMEKEKAEMASKGTFGRPSSTEDSVSRRLSRAVIPGIFPRNSAPSDGLNGCFRPNREEPGRRHGEKSSLRDPNDADSRGLGSSLANGPLNMHGVKDRGSNIGLVHPQPVRKLPDEDPSKSGLLGSGRCNPLEAPSSLFRPPSPTEGFSRYPMMPGLHQHSSQGPCPVHGHEAGHHHGSPGDHAPRANRLPFEGLGVANSDFRGMHSHHPRVRDEMYNINRLSMERREPLPSQIMEEDLRRRGYDWPWPMQHQMFESEQYRRHFINGFRGHEHGYKEMPHGQVYYSPHLIYGPEYPLHMDPYAHSSLPHPEVFPRRYPSSQLSPRLMDFYRRERNLSERPSDRSDSRRQELINEKPDAEMNERVRDMERRNRIEVLEERRVSDDHYERKEETGNVFPLPRGDRFKTSSKPKDDKICGFSAEKLSSRSHLEDEPRKNMHIMERLELITKSSNESGPSVDGIIVKDESGIDNSKSFVAESELKRKVLDQDENEAVSKWPCSDDSDISASDLVMEDMEKKMDYMSSLGLIPHGKRRALEEDYERKRWERKVMKMRGRPKKRRRREQTDDSEGRPCSELDFYNGPMTRHKQQLLQEQEMLLEQVQKNQEENGATKETDENDEHKGFSNSFSSCPTNNSELENSPTNFTGQPNHPLSIETNRLDGSAAAFAKSSHLLKLYSDSTQGKNFGRSDMLRDNKHYSKFNGKTSTNRETHEARELDSYVYGRRHVDEAGSRYRWSGIEDAARSYVTYKNEREIQENRMKKVHDRLKNEDEIMTKQRQQLQKDIMALRERRNRLGENRQKLQNLAKNLHQALRSMANA